MSKDGFATFISDDLPGFNSLNGSGFFDMAGNWNDFDEGNPADNDCFGEEECFEVIPKANPTTVKEDVYFCVSEDEDEDLDLTGGSSMGQSSRRDTPTSQGMPKSCRRRSTAERPKGERKQRTTADGKRRPMRRSKTVNEASDAVSVSSRRSLRRNKTADGSTRKMNSGKQTNKRSENLKKKSLDLGSKLSKLQGMNEEPSEVVKGGRRMRRGPSSNKNLLSDETSVVSRGVQSTAGASVGRGSARRRRASQQHDLLARNLQQFAKANENEFKRSSTTDLTSVASAGGKEEVWRARRRRSVQALSTPMPAIAA